MSRILSVLILSIACCGTSFAQTPAPSGASCEAKAVSKDGKPLAGAAKASSIKKCQGDALKTAQASCEEKAVSKDGKKLAGAAKASFVKKCVTDAK